MSVYYLHKGEEATGEKVAYGDTLCIDGGLAVETQAFGTIRVSNGGEARDVTIDGYYDTDLAKCVGGRMEVLEGGSACGISVLGLADNDYISLAARIFSGTLTVNGGVVSDATVSAYGVLDVKSGAVYDASIGASGRCTVGNGGVLGGRITLKLGCRLTMEEGSVLDFTVANCACEANALLNDISMVPETASFTITVLENQSFGRYCLAENATAFDCGVTVKADGESLAAVSLEQAGNSDITQRTYSLKLEDRTLWLEITPSNGEFSCVANADGVSYTISIATESAQCLLLGQNGGKAKADVLQSATIWNLAGAQTTLSLEGGSAEETIENAAANIVARATGKTQTDVFLANATAKWKDNYYAAHKGTLDGWQGTDEKVLLKGRNVIGSIFDGGDAGTRALICLTDDANGDALFVDDIYTELPEGVEEKQARIARIDEIRAGAGDDVVDLTSQFFEYVGGGLTIRGGMGDDVIWANAGDNTLFGDEGNDRMIGAGGDDVLVGGIGDDYMHGGGGNDIFCFCNGWGNDVVEQLPGGNVVLWFASGNDGNWNDETMTYIDGDNSVRVVGVAPSDITLRFNDDGSEQYDELLAAGAFAEYSSERIFESKGMLA